MNLSRSERTKRSVRLSAVVFLFLMLFSGCARGPGQETTRALSEGCWRDAIPNLEEQISRSPGDGALHRELGRAYLGVGRYEEAVAELRAARDFIPRDRSIPLLLGLCYEGRNDWNKAIHAYRSYPGSKGKSNVARAVRGRITRLVRRVYAERAEAILQEPGEMSGGLLAVRYFEVLAEAEAYGHLGKGLAEQLISDLSQIEGVHIVARLSYEELSKEVERARSRGLDPLATNSLDAMLGAGWSLGGTILPREERDEIRFDFFLVNNITGEVLAPTSLSGSLSEFFDLEKRIVFEVSETLGVPPSAEERKQIGEVPTTNFKAFLSYCNALDAEDRGDNERARTLFRQAVRLDPGFRLAEERGDRSEGELSAIHAIAAHEIEAPSRALRIRRLERTAAMLVPAPLPTGGEASDLSNVRPFGSAGLTVRVDKP